MRKSKVEKAMIEQGTLEYPREACGVIVSVKKRAVAVPCKNISIDPVNYFIMDPEDYANAADRGEIVGIWHTHTDRSAQPSQADLVGCENSGVPWYILSVCRNEAGEFVFDGPTITKPSGFEMPYVGRPYVFGVMDCYSLVRDYYKRELGIKLGDGPRIEFFWRSGIDLLTKGAQDQQLIQQFEQEPQKGDLFLMITEGEVPNHVAIYIGDDMILHHPHDRLSRRDVYAGYWRKHTCMHLRHTSLC